MKRGDHFHFGPPAAVGAAAVSLAVWMTVAILSGPVLAQAPPDVGIVMSVSGEARYDNPADMDGPEPVQAFMKVRRGDRIFLTDRGRIDLLFLEKGRRETWTGPARLTLAAAGAVPDDPGATPEVSVVKAPVSMAIEGTGLPLPRDQIARGGVNVVRGLVGDCPEGTTPLPRPVSPLSPEDRAEIASARSIYEDLRRQTHAVDPLPDLYYLSVLSRHEQFKEMDRIIDRLRRIHGDLPALGKWSSWIGDNYPVRLSFFLLTPDDGCRRGPACFGLGDMGYFRKTGPCPASELDQKQIHTGDILTFALANTSDSPLYCSVVNIDGAGKIELLFPEAAGDPETARLAPGAVLDLFSDAGIGLMPESPGREIIRVYLSPSPLSKPDLTQIREGTADHLNTIDARLRVSKRS